MRCLLPALPILVMLAVPARADIAVLTNGQTFKVTAQRVEEGLVYLSLKDGGEIGVPAVSLRGLVPDEVVEEVAAAPAGSGELRELATAVARRHGLDPGLVLAVVSVESAFRPEAVSRKGAQGLMQLMPATAASLGVKDAFDPVDNLDGGSRHLGSLLTLYGGDLVSALAAYNAGAGAVARHGGVPPYRETRAYVKKVLERYQAAK
jgi:soluble lytic murein transglycosylase-like protein